MWGRDKRIVVHWKQSCQYLHTDLLTSTFSNRLQLTHVDLSRPVITTPLLTGSSAGTALDVDVTGAQVVDLDVDDAGNGNAENHATGRAPCSSAPEHECA